MSYVPQQVDTVHFMSTKEFELMKPDSTFISIGRGTVVDEAALVHALNTGQIGEIDDEIKSAWA